MIDSQGYQGGIERARARLCRGARQGVTPWQILVSEFMLQQTPVSRGRTDWLAWSARWPIIGHRRRQRSRCAAGAWGQLGYPRRAKRLHECAGVIADMFDDVVRPDVETLLTLPGIGAYTARAVACFAYQQRVPVVDTNVRRVVARAVAWQGRRGGGVTAGSRRRRSRCCPMMLVHRFFGRADGAGRDGVHGKGSRCGLCPLTVCTWRSLGYPAGTSTPSHPEVRGHRPPGPRSSAGCAARQRLSVTRAQLDVRLG